MNYQKRKLNPYRKVSALMFSIYAMSLLLVSSLASSTIYATYDEQTVEEVLEDEKENNEEKQIPVSTTISGQIKIADFDEEVFATDLNSIYYKGKVDSDPLVNDHLAEYYSDTLNSYVTENVICEYADYLEYNMPFTTHFDRDYSTLSTKDLLVLEKIVVKEIGNCTFEQQAATAAMCLNRLYDDAFPDTMFENAIAPYQFDVSYGYEPWPESSEKTKAAIELALLGIDFSCNAVSFYTPEYSSKEGIKYFEECTTTTAIIPSKYPNETSIFACVNENKDDALNATKYIYSSIFNKAIIAT